MALTMRTSSDAEPIGRRVPAGVAKAVFVGGLLALSLATTFTSSEAAFSDFDLRAIIALAVALNGIVLCAVLLAVRPGWLANALLAALTVFGIATAYAIHAATHALLWALLGATAFPLFVAFSLIDRWRWSVPRLAVLALFALAPSAASYWWRQESGDTAWRAGQLRDVAFVRKPNVYFVSFDAIAPRAVLRKYLDIETTAFHDLFAARFRRFENFFANAVYTKHSLGAVLALSERTYADMLRQVNKTATDEDVDLRLFSGHNPSPLFEIFKRNGYQTTTVYRDTYFGVRKGPHVDRYFAIRNRTVCGLLDGNLRPLSFWGYCAAGGHSLDDAEVSLQVIDRAGEVGARGGPQFVMAHVYAPGHTDLSFRYEDEAALAAFRAEYLHKSGEAAASLARLLRHLDEHDPQAVALVYGDHGPLLSQGVAFEDAPEFVVQDHYGVLGGVHPPDACGRWFDEAAAGRPYLTVLDAVRAVLRCLAGGQGVAPVARGAHRIGDWQGVVPGGANMTYAAFTYE